MPTTSERMSEATGAGDAALTRPPALDIGDVLPDGVDLTNVGARAEKQIRHDLLLLERDPLRGKRHEG